MDTRDIEAAWRYVHGEMDAVTRRTFEDRLRTNAELAREVARNRALDRQLRLLPLAKLSQEALADRVLQSMESDSRPAADPVPTTERADILTFPRRSWIERLRDQWRIPLAAASAAAAAALILLGLPYHFGAQVDWTRPELAQSRYRASAQPRYTPQDAAACVSKLRRVIGQNLRPHPRGAVLHDNRPWQVVCRFSELPDGGFRVEVEADGDGRGALKRWEESFGGLGAFESRVDDFGRRIAAELAVGAG